MNSLAMALFWAAGLAHNERNPAEAERWASELIELSTRDNFVFWLSIGAIYRGWARSASGDTAQGIQWIEQGIKDFRAELHRLRGVFLAALGADEAEIEAAFCAAITTAREQKSVLMAKRAEASYAEYRRQKARVSGGHVFRLPLC